MTKHDPAEVEAVLMAVKDYGQAVEDMVKAVYHIDDDDESLADHGNATEQYEAYMEKWATLLSICGINEQENA